MRRTEICHPPARSIAVGHLSADVDLRTQNRQLFLGRYFEDFRLRRDALQCELAVGAVAVFNRMHSSHFFRSGCAQETRGAALDSAQLNRGEPYQPSIAVESPRFPVARPPALR
jgi:hypothetical protein